MGADGKPLSRTQQKKLAKAQWCASTLRRPARALSAQPPERPRPHRCGRSGSATRCAAAAAGPMPRPRPQAQRAEGGAQGGGAREAHRRARPQARGGAGAPRAHDGPGARGARGAAAGEADGRPCVCCAAVCAAPRSGGPSASSAHNGNSGRQPRRHCCAHRSAPPALHTDAHPNTPPQPRPRAQAVRAAATAERAKAREHTRAALLAPLKVVIDLDFDGLMSVSEVCEAAAGPGLVWSAASVCLWQGAAGPDLARAARRTSPHSCRSCGQKAPPGSERNERRPQAARRSAAPAPRQ